MQNLVRSASKKKIPSGFVLHFLKHFLAMMTFVGWTYFRRFRTKQDDLPLKKNVWLTQRFIFGSHTKQLVIMNVVIFWKLIHCELSNHQFHFQVREKGGGGLAQHIFNRGVASFSCPVPIIISPLVILFFLYFQSELFHSSYRKLRTYTLTFLKEKKKKIDRPLTFLSDQLSPITFIFYILFTKITLKALKMLTNIN